MAFGGVETGSMKPSDAESAMATDTGTGFMPAEMAAVMARGPIMFVAAVWLVSSESSRAMTEKTATIAMADGSPPIIAMMPSPTHFERPVLYIMPPIARPPPKRISVPHSMPSLASFQLSVNSRFLKFTGSRKSSSAPSMAATASGNRRLYILSTGEVLPSAIERKPGRTQSTTATPKQKTVFF